jgi:arginase
MHCCCVHSRKFSVYLVLVLEIIALQSRVDNFTRGGMVGARMLAEATARALSTSVTILGQLGETRAQRWYEDLEQARPQLQLLRDQLDDALTHRRLPLLFSNKCASSIATLPVVNRHYPGIKVLWLDAHGDFNTPETSVSAFLGGMVLTAPLGLWKSGFGEGLTAEQIVLAGTRDLDLAEEALISDYAVAMIPSGSAFASRVLSDLGDGLVYVHLDLDVLEPGQIRSPYRVPNGIHLADVEQIVTRLIQSGQLVGIEIAEFEARDDLQDEPEIQRVVDLFGAFKFLQN